MTSEDKEDHLKISKPSFSAIYFFCLTPNLLKTFQEFQQYDDANFALIK